MPEDPKNQFWNRIEQYKIPLALSLVGGVLIAGGMFVSGINKPKQEFPKESIVENTREIQVDVSGAVNKPGVYQLKEGDRVEDAIGAAGGFSEQVNGEFISKNLNMAAKLTDGAKIYVPYQGDAAAVGAGQGGVSGASTQAKININTASQSELESLNGVGPVTASKIISGRPYRAVEDLLNRKIVGKATFEKIKDSITIY